MNLKHDIRAVARRFQIHGEFLRAAPYGSGHINDTYRATFDQGGARVRYIFQRINHAVFKNPVALMENVQRVTAHLAHKSAGSPRETGFSSGGQSVPLIISRGEPVRFQTAGLSQLGSGERTRPACRRRRRADGSSLHCFFTV